MAAIKQLTVSEALAQGYSKCLQDGYSNAEDIDDLTPDELENNEYWVLEKESVSMEISSENIREMIADHVRNQEDYNDEDDDLGEEVDTMPLEVFEEVAKYVTDKLAKHTYWPATHILLIPDPS